MADFPRASNGRYQTEGLSAREFERLAGVLQNVGHGVPSAARQAPSRYGADQRRRRSILRRAAPPGALITDTQTVVHSPANVKNKRGTTTV